MQLSPEVAADGLDVHEVAEPPSRALVHLVLAAARLPEVRHGGELGMDGPA